MSPAIHSVSCPFCDETVQSLAFLNHDDFLAVYNIAPVLPGHSLIIPKMHITSLFDLTELQMSVFFTTARMALRVLMKAFNTDAFDWSIQEKEEAGQTIEHIHLHIVPRLRGDLKYPGDWYPLIHNDDNAIIDSMSRERLNTEAMQQITGELRKISDSFHFHH